MTTNSLLTNALAGVTVLDFAQVGAGPLAAMVLADMGARVIKFESFGGDIGRKLGPPWQVGESVNAMAFNRNKRSIALDLKHQAGAAIVHRMVRSADVVVESFRPGVMDRLGVGYAALAALQPRLIYCGISAYGQSGPWRDKPGVDGALQAISGLMSQLGSEGDRPSKVQIPAVDVTTGFLGALAISNALHTRNREGRGGFLDVSMYNASLMLQSSGIASYLASGELPPRTGSAAPYSAPNEAVPTADGWIMLAAYHEDRWQTLIKLLEDPVLASDPRFADSPTRVANREAMVEQLARTFRGRTTAAWQAILEAHDIIATPITQYDDVAGSPQVAHNRALVEFDHPVAGRVRQVGFALGDDRTAERIHHPPPMIGEHTREVLEEFGFTGAEVAGLLEARAVRQWNDDER